MGIRVEFNPDLALRSHEKYISGECQLAECIPEEMTVGSVYDFLKKDQRNYWLEGEIPLLITQGNSILSKPIASIVILEATHFVEQGQIFTRGKYLIKEVFDQADYKIHFDGFKKLSF